MPFLFTDCCDEVSIYNDGGERIGEVSEVDGFRGIYSLAILGPDNGCLTLHRQMDDVSLSEMTLHFLGTKRECVERATKWVSDNVDPRHVAFEAAHRALNS